MSVEAFVEGDPAAVPGHSGIIKLAILAVGGQGGGVLTNWILDVAAAGGDIGFSPIQVRLGAGYTF